MMNTPEESPPLPALTSGQRYASLILARLGAPLETTKREALPRLEVLTPVASKDGAQWKVSVSQGKVIDIAVAGASALNYIDITNLTTAGVPILHNVSSGDYGYVSYNVAIDGSVSNTPSFSISASNLTGAHYYPNGFSFAGSTGAIKVKLFRFTIVDGVPFFEYFHSAGHIIHYRERSTWRNRIEVTGTTRVVGDLYDVALDAYYLKVLRQVGTGKPIMKPLAGAETAEKSIDFRSIKQRDTSPQIKVNAAAGDDNIIVEGNNLDGNNAAVTVVDGLVTEVKTFTIPAGLYGTFHWSYTDVLGGGVDSNYLELTFVNGQLTSAAGTLLTGMGTVGSPYAGNFDSYDH
jgi:hypothetical protein